MRDKKAAGICESGRKFTKYDYITEEELIVVICRVLQKDSKL